MKKTKKKLRLHNARMKEQQNIKIEKANEERKTFLILRKRKRKEETTDRAKKFFEDRDQSWQIKRNKENLVIPSIFSKEGGKCTKKKSPLDLY